MDEQIVELCNLRCYRRFKTVQQSCFRSRQVQKIVYFCETSGESVGSIQPPVYGVLEAFPWEINGPEQEPKVTPSNVEVMHAWSRTTRPLHVFVQPCVIKANRFIKHSRRRSQWPRGLRRRSTATRLLGL